MNDLKFVSADILVSFLRPFSKYKKNLYYLFTMSVKKQFQCWGLKLWKHCEILLKFSNEIKQYVKNTIPKSL